MEDLIKTKENGQYIEASRNTYQDLVKMEVGIKKYWTSCLYYGDKRY